MTLGLVGRENDRHVGSAQDLCEPFIHGGDPNAGIDQEQRQLGLANGDFGLRPHPRFERLIGHVLEPGCVNQDKGQVSQPPFGFLTVARHARLIVDQRELLSSQTIKQRGLADIRSSHNGDFQRHGAPRLKWFSRRHVS